MRRVQVFELNAGSEKPGTNDAFRVFSCKGSQQGKGVEDLNHDKTPEEK